MKENPFYENQKILWEQRQTLRQIRAYHAELTDPALKPMFLKLEGFSPYDDAANVAAYIINDLARREADYQVLTTTNAIEKMKTAMHLVEAQIALAVQADPVEMHEISAGVMADQAIVELRDAKLVKAFTKADESGRVDAEQREVLRATYDLLMRARDNNAQALVRPDILDFEREELIEYIGEQRCEAVRHVLDANQDHMNKVATDLNHAAYLIKARDENIIPESVYLTEEIQSRLGGAVSAMEKCQDRLKLSRNFMERIWHMGADSDSLETREFRAVKYNLAPLHNLFA